MRQTTVPGVELRSCDTADEGFLQQVYASSRADELAQLADWTKQQKQEFISFQFLAQHTHYREHYPDASYDLILVAGEPAGRLYVDVSNSEVRLMDIALLPGFRGKGIGKNLVREVMRQAEELGAFVSLHVEEHNPARLLYESLGFRETGEVTFYKRMEWHPD